MTTAPPDPGPPASPLPTWLGRYGLAASIFLVVPVLFLVVGTVMAGLAPDAACPLCAVRGELAPLDPTLTGAAASEARVARWVSYIETLAPSLTEETLRFAWQEPDPPDPWAKVRSGLALAADDLGARYAFAVPACILILIGVPFWLITLRQLVRCGPFWLRLGLGVSLAAIVLGIVFQDTNTVRLFTAEYLLAKAALAPDYGFLTPETWLLAFWTVDVATVISMAAASAVIVLFAALAVRDLPGDAQAGQEALTRRAEMFKTALILGSIVLVLAVASAHGLMHWSAVLLEPKAGETVSKLASAAGLYWGLLYSVALLGISAPAALAIHLNLRQLAERTGAPTAEIAAQTRFAFDLRQISTTALTLAGPVLTGPVLDLLQAVAVGTG